MSEPAPPAPSAPPDPPAPVPAEALTAKALLQNYRHRAPLTRTQLVAVVAAIRALLAAHGEAARGTSQYASLLRLLKAHCHPAPQAHTFAQRQGAVLQLRAREHLAAGTPLPEALTRAIGDGIVSGFDATSGEEIPPEAQWAQLRETNTHERKLHAQAVALTRERERLRDPQRGRPFEQRVFPVHADRIPDAPRRVEQTALIAERERALAAAMGRTQTQANELLAKHEDGSAPLAVKDAATLEARLREIKLLGLQRALRQRIWQEHVDLEGTHHRRGRAGHTRELKRLQRDFDKMERARIRQTETEERDSRRKRQLWINACMEHANKFRNYHRDVVKRAIKATNRAMVKYHEDVARNSNRAEREAEKARIQKLKDDDEEGYLELVRKTKNTRVLELLNQTDKYLKDLGAVVTEERLKSGIVAYDNDARMGDGTPAKKTYYESAHAVREEVTEQSSLLVGGTLKEYQLQGIQWMVSLYNNRLNGILADEMGLGKTIQTLGLITYLMETKNNAGPYLIIVPLSTISNWELEFAKWAPALGVVVFKGDKKARRTMYDTVIAKNNFNVCLVTYEYVVRGKNLLKRVQWQHLIIDEGHRIKNHESRLSMVLQTYYTSRNRLLLTGTPLQNSLTELWALLNFLLPNVFKSADSFESWFAAPFAQMGVEKIAANEQQAQLTEEESLLIIRRLHQVLRPFLLRRLKSDVLRMGEQLPEKQEHVLICEMSAWQKYMYKKILKYEKILYTDSHGRQRYDKLSNPAVQLRKCVNHPYLFYQDHSNLMMDSPDLWRSAGKFNMLDACIMKLLKTGHRLLIFNQMTKVVDLQERLLRYRDIPFYRLDGSTGPEDRKAMVEDFNSPDSEINVFLLTTRAGGLGVNLQTADSVIIFDSDWNPSMDKQAQDRAHRIGQQKEVLVLRMITANSIEQDVMQRASFKQGLEQKIIGAGKFDDTSKDSERQEMLRELLRVEEAGSDGEEDEGIPTEEEVNRLLARSEDEFEIFQQVDRERRAEILHAPKLVVDEEIPEWSTKVPPELLAKSKKSGAGAWDTGVDGLMSGGGTDDDWNGAPRKRRAAQNVSYNIDQLTERQYMSLMEEVESGKVESLEDGLRERQRRSKKRKKRREERKVEEEEEARGNGRRRKRADKENGEAAELEGEGLPPLPPVKRNSASKPPRKPEVVGTDEEEDIDDSIKADDDDDIIIEDDEDDDEDDIRISRRTSVDRFRRDTSDSEATASNAKGRGSLAPSESSVDTRKNKRRKRVRLISSAEEEARNQALAADSSEDEEMSGSDGAREEAMDPTFGTPEGSPRRVDDEEDDEDEEYVVEKDAGATGSESDAPVPNGAAGDVLVPPGYEAGEEEEGEIREDGELTDSVGREATGSLERDVIAPAFVAGGGRMDDIGEIEPLGGADISTTPDATMAEAGTESDDGEEGEIIESE